MFGEEQFKFVRVDDSVLIEIDCVEVGEDGAADCGGEVLEKAEAEVVILCGGELDDVAAVDGAAIDAVDIMMIMILLCWKIPYDAAAVETEAATCGACRRSSSKSAP